MLKLTDTDHLQVSEFHEVSEAEEEALVLEITVLGNNFKDLFRPNEDDFFKNRRILFLCMGSYTKKLFHFLHMCHSLGESK